MGSASAGTQKMVEKLKKSIEAGTFYEAQQMYKSVHARYVAKGKYAEAVELVHSGACSQLEHNQVNCGAELAVILVETLVTANILYSEEILGKLRDIYQAFPRVQRSRQRVLMENDKKAEGVNGGPEKDVAAAARVEGCSKFLKAALKWSAQTGGPKSGAPELHDMLAEYIWDQSVPQDLAAASKHFVRGTKPGAFAKAIIECIQEGYPEETDLFLARGVLQYLALGKLKEAKALHGEVQRLCNEAEGLTLPAESPLMHFLHFLLLALEKEALSLFTLLKRKYRPSLARDPTFQMYLEEIGHQFYDQPRQTGVLDDLMKMFTSED